jgi:hypothetical protein
MENTMVLMDSNFVRERVYNQRLIRKAANGEKLSDREILDLRKSISSAKKIYKRLKEYTPGVDMAFDESTLMKDEKFRDDFYISTGYFDGQDTKVAVLETIFDLLSKDKKEEKNILIEFLSEVFEGFIEIYEQLANKSKLGKLREKNTTFELYLIDLKMKKIGELKKKNRKLENTILEDLLFVASLIFDLFIKQSQTILVLIHLFMQVLKIVMIVEKIEVTSAKVVFGKKLKELLKDLIFFIIKKAILSFTKEKLSDDIYDLSTLFFDKLGKNR